MEERETSRRAAVMIVFISLSMMAQWSQYSASELGDLMEMAFKSLEKTVDWQAPDDVISCIGKRLYSIFPNEGMANPQCSASHNSEW